MLNKNIESADLWLDNIIDRFDSLSRKEIIRMLIYFCREMQSHAKDKKQKEAFKLRAERLWKLRSESLNDFKKAEKDNALCKARYSCMNVGKKCEQCKNYDKHEFSKR